MFPAQEVFYLRPVSRGFRGSPPLLDPAGYTRPELERVEYLFFCLLLGVSCGMVARRLAVCSRRSMSIFPFGGKMGESSLNAGPRVVEGVVAGAYQGPAWVPGLIFTGPGLRRFPSLEMKIRRHLRLGLRGLGGSAVGIPGYIYQPFHVLGEAGHLTGHAGHIE